MVEANFSNGAQKYKVSYSELALKDLEKLKNKEVSKQIFDWIEKNLNGTENPRSHGKALKGKLAGYWRYRVNNYRIITEICRDIITIHIILIGHRSKVYDDIEKRLSFKK